MRRKPRRRLLPLLAVLAAASVPPGPAGAQTWSADAGVGQESHRLPAGTFDTFGGQLGIRRDGAEWLYLSAGIPFDASGTPWAAAGLGTRLPLLGLGPAGAPRAGIGVDLAGHGFGYADRVRETTGGGVVAEALPAAFVTAGPLRLDARSGMVHYARGGADTAFARTVHHSDARATYRADGFAAYGEARLVRADDGAYPFAGGGVEAELGVAAAWAYAGRWLDEDAEGTAEWGGGLRVPIALATSVYAAIRQDTRDPLFREPPRLSWTVGVSRRLGPGAVTAAPAPALAPRIAGDRVTFRVALSEASEAPSLAGDFTNWQPVPMTRGEGGWVLTLRVPSGVHRYAFRAADGNWFVPPGTPGRRDDGMGGVTAVVAVP
jgi:hypothetical protein